MRGFGEHLESISAGILEWNTEKIGRITIKDSQINVS